MEASVSLEYVITILKNSKNDTEQLAALLLVARLVKAEQLTSTERRALFEAVGFKFLNRLLKSGSLPEGCSPNMYKSVAISILGCFATDESMVTHPRLLANLPTFNQIISSSYVVDLDSADKNMLDDIYDILTAILNSSSGQKNLNNVETIKALSAVVAEKSHGWLKAWSLLECMMTFTSGFWSEHVDALIALLERKSREMKTSRDANKFEACALLWKILSSVDKETSKKLQESALWDDIRAGLIDILQSRLSEQQRNPALKLASAVVSLYSLSWLIGTSIESGDSRLVRVLVNLCCIEVRMALEDQKYSEISEQNMEVVVACLLILEDALGYLHQSVEKRLFDEKQVIQLDAALNHAFTATVTFLVSLENSELFTPFSVALFRIVGLYCQDQEVAVSEEFLSLLPRIIAVFRCAIYGETESSVDRLTSDIRCVDVADAPPSCDSSNTNTVVRAAAVNSSEPVDASNNSEASTVQSCCDSVRSSCLDAGSPSAAAAAVADGSGSSSCEFVCVGSEIGDQARNIINFLLCGLCHVSSCEETRLEIINSPALQLIVNFFTHSLNRLVSINTDSVAENSMFYLCDIVMNLSSSLPSCAAVLRPTLAAFVEYLVRNLPVYFNRWQLAEDKYVLRIFLTSLALNLLALVRDDIQTMQPDVGRFVKAAVEGLNAILTKTTTESGSFTFTFKSPFSKLWSLIEEPYSSSVSALADCVTLYQDAATGLLSTGWISTLIQLLLDVEGVNLSKEMSQYLQNLIFVTASKYPEAKQTVLDAGGSQLAEMYNFANLRELLSTS